MCLASKAPGHFSPLHSPAVNSAFFVLPATPKFGLDCILTFSCLGWSALGLFQVIYQMKILIDRFSMCQYGPASECNEK